MPCRPCQAKKAAAAAAAADKKTFEVVAAGGSIVYKTSNEGAAKTVAARYRGATVRTLPA